MTNNLELYKVFYYVAKTGSLTKAAAALSITQPAVSQNMKQLEGFINQKLFVRTSKGIRLTTEGETLFSYVEKGYEAIELGEKKLRNILDLNEGELRIGATDLAIKYFLLPYLEEYRLRYPNIHIKLKDMTSPEAVAALEHNEIDICLVSGPMKSKSNLNFTKVRTIQDIFVVGSNYLYLRGQGLPYQIVGHLPLICLDSNSNSRACMEEFFKSKGLPIKPEYELSSSDMIVQFAIRNLGAGYVAEDFAKEAIEKGELIRLRFDSEIPVREMYVGSHQPSVISKATEALIEMMG